jgi:predicted AAA+ superfamily ATPase
VREISKNQVLDKIATENPWLKPPHEVPAPFKDWEPRTYIELLHPQVKNTKVRRAVVLMGPRRVGKTVLKHHCIQKLLKIGVRHNRIFYLSVDHPIYTGLDLEQLLLMCSKLAGVDCTKSRCFVFFDEIQYLKNWELYLKAIIDHYPKVKCIVSGSAAAALKLKSSESGAGRFTEFLLPPLTFHEYVHLLGKDKVIKLRIEREVARVDASNLKVLNNMFLDYMNFGGYPEALFSEEIRSDPARFIKSDIIDKVLLRDLPSLYGIEDIQELNYLFTTLAFNTANEVSLEQLSKNSGVAKNTIKRYLEYLEAAFLIKIVHRVDINARRFRRANYFKIYLTNPSIRSALFSPITNKDPYIGYLVETAIFSQWFHSYITLHYARWNTGEIDIVNLSGEKQKPIWVVEAKWSDKPYRNPGKLNNIVHFCHNNNLKRALVTTHTKRGSTTIKSVDIEFMPASEYCYILGYNIIRAKKWLQV